MNFVQRAGLRLIVFPFLEEIGLICAHSTRPLDVRQEADRRRLVGAVGLDPERAVIPRQIHKSEVVRLDRPPDGPLDADGLVTDRPGMPLLLRAADCSLIVVADPVHRAVGVAHAGWKGSARGVVVNLVKALHGYYGSRPAHLRAGIGPTIRRPSYPVGPEVPAAFLRSRAWIKQYVHVRGQQLYFDLPGVNAHFLRECGVPRKHIDECPQCTFDRDDLLHSFRREGTAAGQHGLVAAWPDE